MPWLLLHWLAAWGAQSLLSHVVVLENVRTSILAGSGGGHGGGVGHVAGGSGHVLALAVSWVLLKDGMVGRLAWPPEESVSICSNRLLEQAISIFCQRLR